MPLFDPILAGATWPGRLVACAGAAIGIALTVMLCAWLPHGAADLPVIVAPLGASAVLVFAVPSSPLARPWPVMGGNVLSTVVGVAMFRLVPDVAVAAGLAVGGAILVMSLCRCLHPPGGAAALTAVIGGPGVHAAGYGFALAPVGINSAALLIVAFCFHAAVARFGRSRSDVAVPPPVGSEPEPEPRDIDAALRDMDEAFDISREDLDTLLTHAARHAAVRRRKAAGDGRRAFSERWKGR